MELLKKLVAEVAYQPVDEVTVGIFSTLVKSPSGCGIASTLRYAGLHQGVRNAGKLEQLSLSKLARFLFSENLLEASIGMAAVNCSLSSHPMKYKKTNAKEIIAAKGNNKIVGVIGHFPFLENMRENFKKLYIFEKFPHKNDLKEDDIPRFLPEAELVAITGTAITNHTFDSIMKWTSKKSYKIVLGPSTPLSPLLFDYSIDVIAGTRILDYEYVRTQVAQATPTRYLDGIEFVALTKEEQ